MFVNVVVVNWKNYGRKARNLQILASFCPFVIVQIYVFKNKPFVFLGVQRYDYGFF